MLAPAGAAHAAEPCLSEVVTGAGFPTSAGSRCDDVSPPETSLTDAEPRANRAGYLAQDSVAIAFAGAYADADADPISFECQLYATAEAPSTWDSCTSPVSYTGLEDTGTLPYTFRVRAVDGADRAIDATAGGGLLQPIPAETDLPDYDETPSSASFFVDTTTPNTFVFGGAYDQVTPDHPMLTQPALQVELTSNESDVAYVCSVKGRPVGCQVDGETGQTVFARLRPGDQALRVAAVDRAGNIDPTPTYTPFSVPTNLGPRFGRGWTKVRAGGGFFARDFVQSTREGATLSLRPTRAKELRLIAPTGPGLGVVALRIGAQQPWIRIDQAATTSTPFAVVYQHFFGRRFSGTVSIRVRQASRRHPAVVDAVLVH
ncbi:hypothetical protein BH11ACT8_BH11ACT8_31630 [soil metagenome]